MISEIIFLEPKQEGNAIMTDDTASALQIQDH